jgi:putative nucleotidyltransferase with HDIG domain
MTAQEIIARVKEPPMVAEVALKLPSLLNQPFLHSDEVVKILRCDSVLTAKLLRVCNSASSGMREPVSSVDQAVLMLGYNTIFRMVCALGYGGTMGFCHSQATVKVEGLWNHSLAAACTTEALAVIGADYNFEAPVAFTAGLLHDIGKLVLDQLLTPQIRLTIDNLVAHDATSRARAEKEVFGVDHSDIGACLLRNWHLPEVIVEAVANHHHPVSAPRPQLSSVVNAADKLIHLVNSSPANGDQAKGVDQETAQWLGLEQAALDQIIPIARKSGDQVDQFMAR